MVASGGVRWLFVLALTSACHRDFGSSTCDEDDLDCFLDHLVVTQNGNDVPLVTIDHMPAPSQTYGVVYAAGSGGLYRWIGHWEKVTDPAVASLTYSVGGSGPDDVWVGGPAGKIVHYDGERWTAASGVPTSDTVTDIVSFGAGDAHLVSTAGNGSGRVCFLESGDWICHQDQNAFTPILRGIWGTSATDLWLSGGESTTPYFAHLEQKVVPPTYQPVTGATVGFDVWGNGSDVWNAGTKLQHLVGGTLVDVALGNTYSFRALAGTSSSDIWVSEDYAGVRHFDGNTWSALMPLTARVEAMYATAPDDVWAVGDNGLTGHWDGTSWTESRVPVMENGTEILNGVWASGPSAPPDGAGGPPAVTVSPTTMQFDAVGATAELTLQWTDPNGATPAFCFSLCPRGARCVTGGRARCTRPVFDNLKFGTTVYRIGYSALPPAGTTASPDANVTPASAPNHQDPIGSGTIGPEAQIGTPVPVEHMIRNVGGGGGSGSGSGPTCEHCVNGQPCDACGGAVACGGTACCRAGETCNGTFCMTSPTAGHGGATVQECNITPAHTEPCPALGGCCPACMTCTTDGQCHLP